MSDLTPNQIAIELIKEIFEDFDDMAEEGDFEKLLAKLDITVLEEKIAAANWKPVNYLDKEYGERPWQELALFPAEDWIVMTDQLPQEHAEAICYALDDVWDKAEEIICASIEPSTDWDNQP